MDNHFLELVQTLTGIYDLVGTTFVVTDQGFSHIATSTAPGHPLYG